MRRLLDSRGSVIPEFIVVMVLILVPLAYLVQTVQRIVAARLAVEEEAGRTALAVARGAISAESAAGKVRSRSRSEAWDPMTFDWQCRPRPCGAPGGIVSLTVSARVPLPILPDRAITVSASHAEVVDRFGGHP